jgi:catalase
MGPIKTGWITALAVALPCALAFPSQAQAQDAPVAERIVETMQRLWGKHPGLRVNHAKGIVVEGSFTPAGTGARLSRASLFRGGPVPVTVRFSDATGRPNVADGSPAARPNGIAVRFHIPGGEQMDLNRVQFESHGF